MVRDYELMYIVRPDVDDDGLRTAVDSVKAMIEGQGGEVRKTTMWGKRRLAYEVKHLRDGHYVIVEMRLDGAKVAPVERALRIHDSVFRHLLVVQEAPSAEGEGEAEGEEGGELTTAAATATNGETPAATADATATADVAEPEAEPEGPAAEAAPSTEAVTAEDEEEPSAPADDAIDNEEDA